MRGPRLDRIIDIQRFTSSPSNSGEPVETWSTLASRRSASKRELSGDERFNAPQEEARSQTEFRVRWSEEIAGLNPKDRIVYPANGGSAETGFVYDILAVHRIGRREGFQIITQRNPDVSISLQTSSTAGEPIGLLLLLTKAA